MNVARTNVMRVLWEIPPNPHCRRLHVSGLLFKYYTDLILECDLNDDQRTLVDGLKGIYGLESFSIRPYDIYLMKAKVFVWDEIVTKVESLLIEWSGEELEHLESEDWSNV